MPYLQSKVPEVLSNKNITIEKLYQAYLDLTDYTALQRRELDYLLTHLNGDNVQNVLDILDRKGLNPAFIKWFKNMCYNSSFEVFDSTSLNATYWSTGGYSDPNSNFYGSYSLKLAPSALCQQTDDARVNPQWFSGFMDAKGNAVSNVRVSFHKKGGSVKVEVLDSADSALTVTNLDNESGSYLTYINTTNWESEAYSVSAPYTTNTAIRVKFTNTDAASTAYIDGVIIEPDYTGKWPSAYSDGPHSLGNSKGGDLQDSGSGQIYVQSTEPAGAVEDDVWIDTNDYSRYDYQEFTATGSDTVADEEVVEFTGVTAISYTLSSTGATAGCIKLLKNNSSALVTIVGTIDGDATNYLYPLESCKLIWNGTDWRMW